MLETPRTQVLVAAASSWGLLAGCGCSLGAHSERGALNVAPAGNSWRTARTGAPYVRRVRAPNHGVSSTSSLFRPVCRPERAHLGAAVRLKALVERRMGSAHGAQNEYVQSCSWPSSARELGREPQAGVAPGLAERTCITRRPPASTAIPKRQDDRGWARRKYPQGPALGLVPASPRPSELMGRARRADAAAGPSGHRRTALGACAQAPRASVRRSRASSHP